YEFVDHRRLGFGASRGADRLRRGFESLAEVADDLTIRYRDVLGFRSDALLVHQVTSGTVRADGGRFESAFFTLLAFGADGRGAGRGGSGGDRAGRAPARCGELPAAPPSPHAASRRRPAVRPNAATVNAAAIDAVIAAREPQARAQLTALHVGD